MIPSSYLSNQLVYESHGHDPRDHTLYTGYQPYQLALRSSLEGSEAPSPYHPLSMQREIRRAHLERQAEPVPLQWQVQGPAPLAYHDAESR